MSHKAKKMAQTVNEMTSRRGFLGRLGQVAGSAALGLAGLLATKSASAGKPEKRVCAYVCLPHLTTIYKEVPAHRPCPKQWRGCISY